MRRVFCIFFVLVLVLASASGCLQPTVPKTTPVPAVEPISVTTTIPPAATTVAEKNLIFNVTKSEKAVTITLVGGDTSDLLALDVIINNQDGTKFKQTIMEPVVGFPYVFSYLGYATPVVVNIVGTFKGGYQQTVLMYYFQ